MRRHYLDLALLAAATLSVGACSVYDKSLLSGGPGGGKGGNGNAGGQSGASNGGTDASFTCGHATVPTPPPPSSVVTPGGDIEFVSVMSKIDLGDSPNDPNRQMLDWHYLDLGFDLDGICTRRLSDLKTGQECLVPSYASGMPDGVDGQDNAVGRVVQFTRNAIPNFSSDSYSQQLRNGVTNMILHATNYNGEANDDQVTVETLVSAPFDSPPRAPGTAPNWDGNDVWPVAADSYDGSGNALFFDPSSYVVHGKLVVTLKDADLRLLVGVTTVSTVRLDLSLHGAFIVCDLLPTSRGHWLWTVKNCALGARLAANDLVHQLAQFPDPSDGEPLCEKSSSYPSFKDAICGLVDVSADGVTTTAACDSLSMGLTFDAEPAILGDQFDIVPPVEHCAVGAKPSEDSCENLAAGGGDASVGKTDGGPTDGGSTDAGRNRGTKDASTDR